MDGTAFDRIAKAVGLNRRAALRALVGGLVTGAAITTGDSADAKKKCKGYGGKCTKSSECCANNCKYGYCRAGGGGNRKGTKCNTVTGTKYCDDGYACCKVAGYNVCIPKQACDTCANDDDWDCCSNGGGNQGLCPTGFTCCNTVYGGQCCPAGMHCCQNGCCPDSMVCGTDSLCLIPAASGDVQSVPMTAKVTTTPADWK